MMPAWVYVLGYVALLLVIVATAAIWARLDSRAIAAGTDGQTWRRVRTTVARAVAARRRTAARQIVDAAELARLTAPYAPPRADLTGSPWTSGGDHLHYVGRPIATHASDETAAATGHVGRHREPSTIGDRALVHFPADTHEFDLTFGTVQIGASVDA